MDYFSVICGIFFRDLWIQCWSLSFTYIYYAYICGIKTRKCTLFMPKNKYQLHLEGYVGGWDFDADS